MTEAATRPDHNSLGKVAFILGLVGLVLAFVPLIGFVSWLLGPAAIICGLIAVFRPKRSMAIAGIVLGGFTLAVCFWWITVTQGVGEAMNSDTFNATGQAPAAGAPPAPVMDATVEGVWDDIEANQVAAGQKYGGHRLRFSRESIHDFSGTAASPVLQFEAARSDYLIHYVSATFSAVDGAAIGSLRKGDDVTFVCDTIRESFGDGYGLGGCRLEAQEAPAS